MNNQKYDTAFIIRTPYHYINTLEAIHRYDLDSKKCALIVWTNNFKKKFNRIIQRRDWKMVEKLPIVLQENGESLLGRTKERVKDIVYLAKARKVAWEVGQIDICFSVLPNQTHIQHIINKMGSKKIIMLDEGVGTFGFAKELMDKRKSSSPGKLFGYDRRRNQDIEFFTSFPLEKIVKKIKPEKIERHSFEYIKSKLRKKKVKNDQGLILGTQRTRKINSIYDKFISMSVDILGPNVETIWYKPHRWESDREIKDIKEKYDLEIMSNNEPIEMIIAKTNLRPKVISGFASTAIHSINKILKGKIKKNIVFGCKSDEGNGFSYQYYESAFDGKVDVYYI